LLQYYHGRCGEWASNFLPDVMFAQGVAITSEPDMTVNFTHAVPAQPAGSGPGFFTPAKAQGGKVPTEQGFGDHVVDEFNAGDLGWILLDPSYGVRVSGATQQAAETAWATQAIAAGVQGDWVTPQLPLVGQFNTDMGLIAASAPFAMVPADFVFPH